MQIVLADDQVMIREGLALVLGSEPDLEVVGQFGDGRALVGAVKRLRPDLVLTDVRMPGMDGIEATRLIVALPDPPPVLALTTFDDDEVLWPTLAAGVGGFVLKDSRAESLIEAVRAVAAGGAWLDARILPRVLARAVTQPVAPPDGVHALTTLISAVFFAVALAVVFASWFVSERTLSIHSIRTHRREVFYWAAVMATFALGTAVGDLTAVTFNLGYLESGVLFGLLMLIPAIGYRFFGLNAIFAFWFAYILTRPLGASFADWAGVSADRGGLGLGSGWVSLTLAVLIAASVVYLSYTQAARPADDGLRLIPDPG